MWYGARLSWHGGSRVTCGQGVSCAWAESTSYLRYNTQAYARMYTSAEVVRCESRLLCCGRGEARPVSVAMLVQKNYGVPGLLFTHTHTDVSTYVYTAQNPGVLLAKWLAPVSGGLVAAGEERGFFTCVDGCGTGSVLSAPLSPSPYESLQRPRRPFIGGRAPTQAAAEVGWAWSETVNVHACTYICMYVLYGHVRGPREQATRGDWPRQVGRQNKVYLDWKKPVGDHM